MDVIIQDVVARVRAVDGQSLLSPQTLQMIVRAVLAASEEQARDKQRHADDTRTTASGSGAQT
jgi:hypothetical protein